PKFVNHLNATNHCTLSMFREDFELLQMKGFFRFDYNAATHVFLSLFKHFALFIIKPVGNVRVDMDLCYLSSFVFPLPLKFPKNLVTDSGFTLNEAFSITVAA